LGHGAMFGVLGNSPNGTGVLAETDTGTALDVQGPVEFSRSGLATVAGTVGTPANSVTVKGVALTSASLVLATIQQAVAGIAVQGVAKTPSASKFTIPLTKPVKTNVEVAWFVIG
jgi:hypothetical protein